MTSILMLFTFLVASCCGVEFSSSARNFSVELMYFTHLDHFVMSPFCIWSLVSGAYLGGSGESKRQIQIAAILPRSKKMFFENYNNLTKTIFQDHIRPKLVKLQSEFFFFHDINVSILSSYKAQINITLNADTSILNFKNSKIAANQANNLIQNRFHSTSDLFRIFHTNDFTNTDVILCNVINFRGLLSTPFNASFTTEEIIYNQNNTAIGSVTMMYLRGKLRYSNFEPMSSHILELPYGEDGKFCMLVIFPYVGVDPSDAYKKFDSISMRDIFMKLEKDLNEKGLEVEVKMPRFRIKGSYSLQKPLNDMGVFDAFEPDLARFEYLSREGLYFNTVEHKAEMIFTETETVAFGATPGSFDNQRSLFKVKAQQPFIFFLMEKPTASIIFGGIYSRHQYLNEVNPIIFPDD